MPSYTLALVAGALTLAAEEAPVPHRSLVEGELPVVAFDCDERGEVVYTMDSACVVRAWDRDGAEVLWTRDLSKGEAPAVAVSAGKDTVMACIGFPGARFLDPQTGETNGMGAAVYQGGGAVRFLACDPKARWGWIATAEGVVARFRKGAGVGLVVRVPNSGVSAMHLSGDGKTLVLGGEDGSLRFVNAQGGALDEKRVLEEHRARITAVAMDPKARYVLSADETGELRVWKSRSRKSALAHAVHDGQVHSIACDPRGKWFATGGPKGEIKLWPLATKGLEAAATLQGARPQPVTALLVLDKGKTLASLGDGEGVTLWDVSGIDF